MIDELVHAGPEHLDPAIAAGYDRKQGPDSVDDVSVLRGHGLDGTSVVVDLGAGTGAFTLAVAPHVRSVVAVDTSPAMLDVLRARVAAARSANVECVESGFLAYTHTGPPADLVYSRNALHHLPDLFKVVALERIARILRPNGIFRLRDLVLDCAPEELESVVHAWLDGAVDDPNNGYTREDLAEHLRTEHSTFSWLLEPMLEASGFEILERDFRRSVYGSYTCRRR